MEYIQQKSKDKCLIFFRYILIFALLFITSKAGLNGIIYPFNFGLFFAFLWCNQNIFALSILHLLSGFLADFSLHNLLGRFLFVLIMCVAYGIHYKTKKQLKYTHLIIYACLCNIPKMFIQAYFLNANIYSLFVELLFGLLYTFSIIKIFESFCVRGLGARLTATEKICAMFFIVSVFCGLNSLSFINIDLIKYFGAVLLLILAYTSNSSIVLFTCCSMGVGSYLYLNNPTYLCVFILYGLTVCAFKTKNKYISSLSLIIVECLCGFYLNLYINFNIFSFIPLLLAITCFILFPTRILDGFNNRFEETTYSLTQASVINRNRELLYKRLTELSDVFAEMNKVFRGMISGGILDENAKRLLVNDVKIKECSMCQNKNNCYRMYSDEMGKVISDLVKKGFEKGKVNILDIPTSFASKCDRLNSIVCTINDLISQYKNYAGLVNNIDASKVLLAEQLYGVSNIMRDLSKEVNLGVNFEKGKEKKIIDELTYNNIICSDVLVFEDKDNIKMVTLAVRKCDSLKNNLTKVISKICCCCMQVCEENSSSRAGWQILTLKSAPKYECAFGVATRTKTGSNSSGDCYSVIKINDGKYLFALCDGMGSGEKAEQTSSTAIGLVENFYKAGFDREIIISSVNKLLSLGRDDVFSALDLCVVDTRNGVADFIKMGAPESFVKHRETIDKVEIGALPLGIIQNAESKSKQMFLTSGDKIILVTDGITDGFNNMDNLLDYINNLTNTNPQELAEKIIEKTLEINQNIAKDDMTVLVAKVFEK